MRIRNHLIMPGLAIFSAAVVVAGCSDNVVRTPAPAVGIFKKTSEQSLAPGLGFAFGDVWVVPGFKTQLTPSKRINEISLKDSGLSDPLLVLRRIHEPNGLGRYSEVLVRDGGLRFQEGDSRGYWSSENVVVGVQGMAIVDRLIEQGLANDDWIDCMEGSHGASLQVLVRAGDTLRVGMIARCYSSYEFAAFEALRGLAVFPERYDGSPPAVDTLVWTPR